MNEFAAGTIFAFMVVFLAFYLFFSFPAVYLFSLVMYLRHEPNYGIIISLTTPGFLIWSANFLRFVIKEPS